MCINSISQSAVKWEKTLQSGRIPVTRGELNRWDSFRFWMDQPVSFMFPVVLDISSKKNPHRYSFILHPMGKYRNDADGFI